MRAPLLYMYHTVTVSLHFMSSYLTPLFSEINSLHPIIKLMLADHNGSGMPEIIDYEKSRMVSDGLSRRRGGEQEASEML